MKEPKDTISWKEFKDCIEGQGIVDSSEIMMISFRAFLRLGMENIKPNVSKRYCGYYINEGKCYD